MEDFNTIVCMTVAQNPDPVLLQNEISELRHGITERDEKIVHLEEQLDWFKRQLFGKKSERDVSHVNAEQLEFEGFDQLDTTSQTSQTKTIPAHKRKVPHRNGQESIVLPKDLPVETTIIDIPEDQKVCQETGVPLVKIGEETTYKLSFKPGSFYLKEIIRPKYAYPKQEEKGIIVADLPETLLNRCQADDSFLAFILAEKFVNHMPLYRISESLQRYGITISRKLLSQWVIRCGMALKPLYQEMKKHILQSNR